MPDGPMLITAAFMAPLVGKIPDDPLLHAVTMEEIIKNWADSESVAGACGEPGLKVLTFDDQILRWPVQARGLPSGYVRCRNCWVVTGQKRPRTKWIRTKESVNA